MKRRRVLALIGAAFYTPCPAGAHSMPGTDPPLDALDVEEVLAALMALGTAARADAWRPADAPPTSLSEAVYAYAGVSDRLHEVTEASERALLAYESLVAGVTGDDGGFLPAADSLLWFDVLHPGDVPAVATRRAAFDALRPLFSVSCP